jgi:hypothetical protein
MMLMMSLIKRCFKLIFFWIMCDPVIIPRDLVLRDLPIATRAFSVIRMSPNFNRAVLLLAATGLVSSAPYPHTPLKATNLSKRSPTESNLELPVAIAAELPFAEAVVRDPVTGKNPPPRYCAKVEAREAEAREIKMAKVIADAKEYEKLKAWEQRVIAEVKKEVEDADVCLRSGDCLQDCCFELGYCGTGILYCGDRLLR